MVPPEKGLVRSVARRNYLPNYNDHQNEIINLKFRFSNFGLIELKIITLNYG